MFLDDFFSPFKIDDFTPWQSKTPPVTMLGTVPVIADVFCRCHGFSAVAVVPVIAGIYLVAFLLWLPLLLLLMTNAMLLPGFLSSLRSPILPSALLLLVSLLLLAKLLLLASLICFLAVACIHDVNGITDIPCCCFSCPLLLASMFLWHTLLLLVYRTVPSKMLPALWLFLLFYWRPCNWRVTAFCQHSCCCWHYCCCWQGCGSGSGLNRVSGSGSASRRAKMNHKSKFFFKFMFWELKASSITWTFFMEA